MIALMALEVNNMRLKVFTKGKEEYMEVGFWSFAKCSILVSLAMTGIVYGAVLVLFVMVMV
jgi:hypothetical protein